MDKRIKKSSYLILALVICLCSVTALASTSYTYINIGTESVKAAPKTLTDNDTLDGYVESQEQESGETGNLVGKMYTKGSTFTHCRSSKSVFDGRSNFDSYTCDDPEGGTFWVELKAANANHRGKGKVWN